MRMMPRAAPSATLGGWDARRRCQALLSSDSKEQYNRMVTWRVIPNTWLVKNLQYVLWTLSCSSVTLYWLLRWADFLAFFSQSRQPSTAFSTHLCTWLCKYVRCEGPAALSSPSSVAKKRRPDVVVYPSTRTVYTIDNVYGRIHYLWYILKAIGATERKGSDLRAIRSFFSGITEVPETGSVYSSKTSYRKEHLRSTEFNSKTAMCNDKI